MNIFKREGKNSLQLIKLYYKAIPVTTNDILSEAQSNRQWRGTESLETKTHL